MPASTRQFRLFVSSTFSDLKVEREALRERVFPRLRDLCREHGATFQAVDLRWGVSQEAARDQRTMRICLGEIDRCRKAGGLPDFVALLGDRYGWRPLPEEIAEDDFDSIRGFLAGTGRDDAGVELLERWYGRDDNAVPCVYRLAARTEEFAAYDSWQGVEHELTGHLRRAVAALGFPVEQQRRYTASATEQEIAHRGLLDGVEDRRGVLCFIRRLDGMPSDGRAGEFLDLREGEPDAEAVQLLHHLKQHLREALPHGIHQYRSAWTAGGVSTDPLERLCEEVWGRISGVIRQQLAGIERLDPLDAEIEAHREFGAERTRFFVGRAEPLARIESYLAGPGRHPLVIFGEPGSGKSTLIARALAESLGADTGAVAFRFIGAVPGSANVRTLLDGLCRQLRRRFGGDEAAVPAEYPDLLLDFRERLEQATRERPLVLFLDALDQLSGLQNARRLVWLPAALPEHVHLVVSTLPGECLESLERRVPEDHRHELAPMDVAEGGALLDLWLGDTGRRLQPVQRQRVVDAYASAGLPLYLRLVFEDARQWHSDSPPVELPPDIPGVIRSLFERLSESANHGALLVSRSLSCLAAGKHGLGWDEMLGVLSDDGEIMEPLWTAPHFPISDGQPLPPILWSRLYHDLQPYLTERSADGVATLDFYHRQLREVVERDYLQGDAVQARHRALARFFGKHLPWSEEGDGADESPGLRELSEWPYQLARGGLWRELDRALMDFGFLQAKVFAAGPQSLIEDFDLVLAADDPEGVQAACGDVGHLRTVRDTIRAASQVVTADPAQLASQLCGRLLAAEDVQVQRLIKAVSGWTARPWLRPLKPSLFGGALRFTLRGHKGSVRSLDVTRDGRRCASAGNSEPDRTVRIWDLTTGDTLHVLADQAEGGGYTPLGFTGDGGHLLLGNGNDVVVWSVETGLEEARLTGHEAAVRALSVAETRRAVSGDESGQLCVWDSGSWKIERRLIGQGGSIELLAITPDGRRAVAGASSELAVWDLESGEVVATHAEELGLYDWWNRPPLAITRDGTTVYFGYELKRWSLADEQIETILRQGEAVMSDADVRSVLAVAPESRVVLVSPLEDTVRDRHLSSDTFDTLAIQDLATRESLVTMPPQGSDARAFTLSSDGRRAVVAHSDHSVRVWDVGLDAGSVVRDHDNRVTAVHLMEDVLRAASWDEGNQYRFWDLVTGLEIAAEDPRHAEMDREARKRFESSEAEAEAEAETTPEQESPSPETPTFLIRGRRPDSIRATNAPLEVEFDAPRKKFGEAVDSPDDPSIMAEIRVPLNVWELDRSGKRTRLRHRARRGPSPLWAVRVTHDGQRAVTAAWGSLRVWDLDSGRQLHRLEGHTGPVWNVVLCDGERKAVSVSEDATVRVWDLETGGHLAAFTGESPIHVVEAATVRCDGADLLTVIAGEDSGRVHILRLQGAG